MYKYARLDAFSLTNLRNSQLYCRHYDEFNDPFECWSIEQRTVPDPLKEPERFLAVVDAWGYTPDVHNESDMEMYFKYVGQLVEDDPSMVDSAKNSARISCFCQTADNLLMWAHYADGLRGFCIEFDPIEFLKGTSNNAQILAVKYQTLPATFDVCLWEVAQDQVDYHEDEIAAAMRRGEPVPEEYSEAAQQSRNLLSEMYSKLFATKPAEWHYEQELRLIFGSLAKGTGAEVFCYPDSAIKSITLGERISTSDKTAIIDCLRRKGIGVPVRPAKRDLKTFRVSISD